MAINLDLIAGVVDLGNSVLASVGPPTVESSVWTDNDRTPGVGQCSGTSGDGCVQAGATRTLGQITLGTLPANLPVGSAPLFWQGYLVRINGFTDSVTAEVGVGTKAPTISAAGTISYWNGAGYSSLPIVAGGPVSISVAPVSILNLGLGGLLRVDLSVSNLRTGGTTITDPAACGASCTRTSASAVSGSPVTGDVIFAVSFAGVSLANVSIHVDLGTLTAKGEYKAAPAG
jgi:hypothetical protein